MKPHRKFEVEIKAGGDTIDDLYHTVKQYIDEIYHDYETFTTSCMGGPSSHADVKLQVDPTMTHERYFEELNQYLESKKKPDAPGGNLPCVSSQP